MRRLLLTEEGKLSVQHGVDLPTPGLGEVRLQMLATGVGLLQAQLLTGRADTRGFPRVMGHEIVGLVDALGPGVGSPQRGDVVVVNPVVTCGVCTDCLSVHETNCERKQLLGYERDGGYADSVCVPATNAFVLPSNVTPEHAVMLASAAPTAVHIVGRADVHPGQSVAIVGLGSIGLMVCQVARAFGASVVVGADVDAARLETATDWIDAGLTLSPGPDAASAGRLRELAGAPQGPNVVFETAGHAAALALAVEAVRAGGTVLCVGAIDGHQQIDFRDYFRQFILRELTIRASSSFSMSDFALSLRLHAVRRIDVSPLVGDVVAFDDIPRLIQEIVVAGTPAGKRHVARFA